MNSASVRQMDQILSKFSSSWKHLPFDDTNNTPKKANHNETMTLDQHLSEKH